MGARLDALRIIDPVLSGIADSYENENFVGSKIFPTVKVEKEKGQVPTFGKDAFIIRTTDRGIRADSNRIPPEDFTMVEYNLSEHDIELAIDYRELQEANRAIKYETRVVKNLKDILELEKEKVITDYLQAAGSFAAGLKADKADAWATPATGVPITNIKTGKEAVRALIGKEPNVIIMSKNAYELAIKCTQVTSIIAYSGYNVPSKEIFKQMIDIPNIYIGMGKYSTDGGTTLANLWSDTCVLAYVDQADKASRNEFNPSYGYMFQKEGYAQVDTYETNGGKMKVIRNTDIYGMKVIGASAAYLIYNVGA